MAGWRAAPARDPSPARGRALVNVGARHWARHGGQLMKVGPHVHPERVVGVHAWTRNPAVAAGAEHMVVMRHLRQELLGPDVGLGSTVCSPQDHGEHVRRRLVAAACSLF